MQIVIYRLNDAGDTYYFKDVCLQYETLDIKRTMNYTGTASITLLSDDEAKKFLLEDLLTFQDGAKDKDKREQYIVIDITRNKDVSTNIIKTTITAVPFDVFILGNRIQYYDYSFKVGYKDYTVVNQIAMLAIGYDDTYDVNNDRKVSPKLYLDYFGGDYTKYQGTMTYDFTVPKGKLALDNFKDYTTCYSYYAKIYDMNLGKNENISAAIKVIYPTDKSASVIFSESMGNCVLTDYTLNSENEKNVCYTLTSDGKIIINGAGRGMRRKEMFSDGNEYINELDGKKLTVNAKVTFLDNGMYKYLEDFDLNTIVSFYDSKLGIKIAKPIESITEYYSNDKNEIEISIGEFVPNVFDKLKER